jgi:cbb3-type cytochrome oxidase subunit 3
MTSFYTVLEVIAFIAVIVIPIVGPKRKKNITNARTGNLAVNNEGYLEPITVKIQQHHQVD